MARINNKKLTNKKSFTAIEIITLLILAVVVIFVILKIIPGLLGKSGTATSDLLSASEDPDGDGFANFQDKCICTPSQENEGCPINVPLKGIEAAQREQDAQKRLRETKRCS